MNKRILFMGTPAFATASLEALVSAGFEVAAVVTAPDRPAGRGRKLRESRQSISQIAFDVGYDFEAAFTRAFRREMGQPPATWRKRMQAA